MTFHWLLCILYPLIVVGAGLWWYSKTGRVTEAVVLQWVTFLVYGAVLFVTAPRDSQQTEAGRDVLTCFLLMGVAALIVIVVVLQ